MAPEGTVMSFDPKPWIQAGRFVLRAIRRRWLVVGALFVLFTGVAAAAAKYLPRSYTSETRILAKKNYTMAALAAPRRAVPPSSEAPASSATELVLQEGSLVDIVRSAKLVERWQTSAPPLMQLKESVRERLKGPLGPEDLEDALVGLLRQRLRVWVDQNEIVVIRVTWWNADDVLSILEEAQANFLAERRRLDIETIEETEAILVEVADAQRLAVEQRLSDFRAARAQAQDGNAARIVATRNTAAEVASLKEELVARQRFRMELERQRDMRIADLQLEIAERSASLGERHPDQVAARDALTRIQEDDGGVGQAKALEDELERKLSALGSSGSILGGTVSGSDFIESGVSPDEDAAVIYARSLLRIDVDDYQDMVTRLKNVRVELQAARAAFPFRYMVTLPAERPRKPDSPNVVMVLAGGILAGLMAGALAAVVLEGRAWITRIVREQLA